MPLRWVLLQANKISRRCMRTQDAIDAISLCYRLNGWCVETTLEQMEFAKCHVVESVGKTSKLHGKASVEREAQRVRR